MPVRICGLCTCEGGYGILVVAGIGIRPMGELMGQHLQSLAEYPPVQGGKSFDMSNVVEEFINKARQ